MEIFYKSLLEAMRRQLLDPENESVTLLTLKKATIVLGQKTTIKTGVAEF